jgi:hypothetical protein
MGCKASNSHFEIKPKKRSPKASVFSASKPRFCARRAQNLGFEVHTENW